MNDTSRNALYRYGSNSLLAATDLTGLARYTAPHSENSYTSPPLSALARALADINSSEIAKAEQRRRRAAWNDRFAHWERPASTSEETTLDRGARMVRAALDGALWLNSVGATVERQGSYFHNTNTRIDSDADLRVQLPLYKVDYHSNVHIPTAEHALQLSGSGWTYEELFALMRLEIGAQLGEAFGQKNVTPGKKAFRIKGITGSRAEIDVVPAIRYQFVTWNAFTSQYDTLEGAAILSSEGQWTFNFPKQHSENGIYKRARTRHQFKRIVRIFKKLRADLERSGWKIAKTPSFLIESLIYNVEDAYFTVVGDDRYGRVRRIAHRLQALVRHEATAAQMVEVNGIKRLFSIDQAWTWAQAITFADAVVAHLGDA